MAKVVKNFLDKKWLLGIFLLSLILRIYKVGEIPYGFDGDEASVGYYAFSLIENLSDEYGNQLPLYFPSIGDYKYPGYSYLSTIPVFLLGLNVFSARLLSVISGSLLVVVMYFLAFELTKNRTIARLSSLLLSTSPYAITFSRGAYESNVGLFFMSLGILGLLYSTRNLKSKIGYYSTLPLLISMYTYPAPRVFLLIFIPILLIVCLLFGRKNISSRKMMIRVMLIVVVVSVLSMLNPKGRVRANDIGFMRDPWPSKFLTESIHEDGLALQGRYLLITRAFHNKFFAYTLSTYKRYLEHFNPNYLYASGNPNIPHYSIPNVGLFHFFEFFTVIIGLVALSDVSKDRKIKLKLSIILGAWILISPIPSALSIETTSPIRGLIRLPGMVMLSSVGIWYLYKLAFPKIKNLFIVLFSIVLFVNTAYFCHQYTVHNTYHQPWYSDEGVEEMINAVGKLEGNFENVVISGDPYIHFLFFNKVHPKTFLENSQILPEEIGKWERVERYGKIIFKMPYNCPKIGRERVLYVCKGEEIPQNSILHDVIRFRDGKPAYMLIEFVPFSKKIETELPDRVHWMVDTDLSYHEGLLSVDSGRYW